MSLLKNLSKLWIRPSTEASAVDAGQYGQGRPYLHKDSEGTGAAPNPSLVPSPQSPVPSSAYFIKPGYQSRPKPDYFHDVLVEKNDVVHQPDVYPFAGYLARRFGCTHIVDVGCGSALKLVSLHPEFQVIGVDFGDNLALCAKRYPFGTWIKQDMDRPGRIPISPEILGRSVVVCADVIEHMIHPEFLLRRLKLLMEYAPVALLSTPDRELIHGSEHIGPPPNPHHVREWKLEELEQLIRSQGLNVGFMGWTMNNNRKWEKKTILSVIERQRDRQDDRQGRLSHTRKGQEDTAADQTQILPDTDTESVPTQAKSFLPPAGGFAPCANPPEKNIPPPASGGGWGWGKPPATFKVVAITVAFNEEDIIVPTITQLHAQGIDTYLIDNWSTDRTHELARELLGHGLIGLEKFPPDGPLATYDWKHLLTRIEEVTLTLDADWFIHHDTDEVRRSPWPGVNLREGLWRVDQEGFSAVDHTVVDFVPTDDNYAPGKPLEGYYAYFRFGVRRGHFLQIKAWKNIGGRVSLAESGGHEAQFEGRRVGPDKFLLKHYPVRSQAHGEQKVLRERKARWNAEEKKLGWHGHYDQITEETRFVEDPATLLHFEEEQFNREYLVERLSGVGIVRT